MPPTLYIKNALRLAELGLGDGTVYASGSGATPNISQKTFALTGLTPIADIGADVDDKYNGHLLRFPASKNAYHIVDYTASNDTVTVYENPSSSDTGAFEIRRALVENKSAAGDPAFRLADGQVFSPWKGSAANQAQNIDIYLPNLIEQGGFEELAAGAFPASFTVKGKWYTASANVAVSSTSPILGSRMAVWTPGASDAFLLQAFTSSLRKGRTYKMVLKAQAVTGATNANAIQIYIETRGTSAVISPGFSGGPNWSLGAIGTTAAWFTSPDFTVDSDNAEARIDVAFRLANKGAATAVRIDEIYFFEQVNVGAFLLFNHKWEGMPSSGISGYRCAPDRTGATVSVDFGPLTILQATGADSYLLEFTPAIYPVYRIALAAFSLAAYEASEILLAEKWTWEYDPQLPFDPKRIVFDEKRVKSRSGVERVYRNHSRRKISGKYVDMTSSDLARLNNDWFPHHRESLHPFGVKLSSTDKPILVIDQGSEFGNPYEELFSSWDFELLEIVGGGG